MTGSRMFMLGEAISILAPQCARAVGELAFAHALEKIEVLLGRSVAIGAVFAGLRQRAAIFAHLFGRSDHKRTPCPS